MTDGIAIRFSDQLQEHKVDTIEEHNHVFKKMGRVFVGKFGQPLGRKYISACNIQKSWYLILVKKIKPGVYVAWKAKIGSIQKEKPSSTLYPNYYAKRTDIKIWFELTEPFQVVEKSDLSHWVTKSSNQSLMNSLMYSMSGLFHVKYDPNAKESSIKKTFKKAKGTNGKVTSNKKTSDGSEIVSLEDLDDILWGD